MTNTNEIINKLLFLSEEICYTFDELVILSTVNQEESNEFDKSIEFLDNYLYQETKLLDSINKEDLEIILKALSKKNITNDYINRCYLITRDYFEDKYPSDIHFVDKIEYESIDETAADFEIYGLDDIYEDEEDIEQYRKYVIQKVAILAIKKMYSRIKNTNTDNKIDHKYKKTLLKYFKEFKYNFFTLDRDMELLGVKYRFNINLIPEMPKLDTDISRICFNECINILDILYFVNNQERNPEIIEQALFDMLRFDEYIKELSNDQIDRLINICTDIETNTKRNLYGNIGLQKLVKIKKK